MFGMDPVLSGSLCFLVLAIAMYLKFIREQPWSDEELSDHKGSPVDGDDTMPFLHPASPAGRLQAQQQQQRGPGQGRHQVQQKQQTPRQSPPQPHHGYAGFKQSRQTASSAVVAAGVDATAASGAAYLPTKKQPMRRRTHSATATSTASPSNKVKSGAVAVADGGDLGVGLDQLPTTIYEGANYDQFRQQRQPQDSGRNQHRITFDDYDEEMGFLSPPRHADESLESVSFEAESDGFYDLENHLPEDHLLSIADTPERGLKPLRIGGQYRGGDLLESTDMAEASPDAKTLKTSIERQFVRDVAPPAQMQLEVARKARIPLFLHSPMYVKTSTSPLIDEVDAEFTAEFAAEEALAAEAAGNGDAQAVPAVGAGDAAGAGAGAGASGAVAAAEMHTRRRRPKLSKAKNDSLQVDYKELQIEEMIGQGAFGTVHRAKWRGTAVAVKILVCQYLTADILEEFEAEVQIMSILRHPNICLLMGACLEPPTRCLVIEYLPRGSLWNVLRQDVVVDMGKQYG
ncbi:hypothetical protein PHYPSEUDO_015019 [Phytophthora pseudosyringae]|uniref:non-specific serine/threonine protein kinase n=1 Tax=Phytophthora pseudosyringae TaxID=221518 RepID=A0A8T1WHF8_9STRA|nr:hypothetical protein PHYPSEUDO_015019 [Phytophthora pseudosyringae]